MTGESWHHISAIYNGALLRAGAERAAYIAEECGGNDDLRREVELLLAQGESFLAKPVWLAPGSRSARTNSSKSSAPAAWASSTARSM
jgi:hypothetical protein